MSENTEITSSETNQIYTVNFPSTPIAQAIAEYIGALVGAQPSMKTSRTLEYIFGVKEDATGIMKSENGVEMKISGKSEVSNNSQFDKAA